MLLVAAPFAVAYLLTRSNTNSQVLLIVAIFCAGLALTFTPVDVISTGWYAGLIGLLLAVDAFASRRAREATVAHGRDVWPLALLPGMGLVRLGFFGRGRLWLGAALLAAAFIGVSAVNG